MAKKPIDQLIQQEVGSVKNGASIRATEDKKRQKLQQKLVSVLGQYQVDWSAVTQKKQPDQVRILTSLIDNNDVQGLERWQKMGLPVSTLSAMSVLEYALKHYKTPIVQYCLTHQPYEVFKSNGAHLYVTDLEFKALDMSASAKGSSFGHDYTWVCSKLVQYLTPMELIHARSLLESTGNAQPTDVQWGKLYLSGGRLSEALNWCALHPQVGQDPTFWSHFLECVNERKISLDKHHEVSWSSLNELIQKNMNAQPQDWINFLYKESIRLGNDPLFVMLYVNDKKLNDWMLPVQTPGSWHSLKSRTSHLRQMKRPMHIVHYALAIQGTNSAIVEWLTEDPQVMNTLRGYQPCPTALAALDSIEVRKLARLGVDIEQPLDEQNNRLLHYWAILDGSLPRSGWATMLKRFTKLQTPNDSGVTGLEAQRKQLKFSASRLRDFDLALVKAESKDIERTLDKSAKEQNKAPLQMDAKKPKIL